MAQWLGSESLVGQALQVLGIVASSRRDYEQAVECLGEAIALFEAIDEGPNLGLALFNLGVQWWHWVKLRKCGVAGFAV